MPYNVKEVEDQLDKMIESMRADLGFLPQDQQDRIIFTFKAAMREILADSSLDSTMDLIAFVTANKNRSNSIIPEYVWMGELGEFIRDRMLSNFDMAGDKLIPAWEAIKILWPDEAIKADSLSLAEEEYFDTRVAPKLYMRLAGFYRPKPGKPIQLFPFFVSTGRMIDPRVHFSLAQVQRLADQINKKEA